MKKFFATVSALSFVALAAACQPAHAQDSNNSAAQVVTLNMSVQCGRVANQADANTLFTARKVIKEAASNNQAVTVRFVRGNVLLGSYDNMTALPKDIPTGWAKVCY